MNHQFIKAALPHLVPLLLEQLTKQEEGQETDDGVWNVSMVRWADWLLLWCWALVVAAAVNCKQLGMCSVEPVHVQLCSCAMSSTVVAALPNPGPAPLPARRPPARA